MKFSFSLLLLLLLGFSQAHPTIDDRDEDDFEAKEDDTALILTTNSNIQESLLEGDLKFPHTRNAMMCWSQYQSCRWPKSIDGLVHIPYTIDRGFTDAEKNLIKNAMKEFELKGTCIRFVSRSSEWDHIKVINGRGCYSSLGKVGGAQELSLKNHGCLYSGIVQHELLHALGFRHEQTRSDRDNYVTINWENIQYGREHNFELQQTINLDTPYDFKSIMHYGKKAFSRNGKETITPIKYTSANIGQRWAMSANDVLRINALYGCN